ncbi:uncharacterized protein LOC131292813, partial [Anopheles ziemanni]|uniref:uncharacterized protein LOC131271162 n=1 Tax=Anopheles coustani TaxID=139045 RepID=UPI0026593315
MPRVTRTPKPTSKPAHAENPTNPEASGSSMIVGSDTVSAKHVRTPIIDSPGASVCTMNKGEKPTSEPLCGIVAIESSGNITTAATTEEVMAKHVREPKVPGTSVCATEQKDMLIGERSGNIVLAKAIKSERAMSALSSHSSQASSVRVRELELSLRKLEEEKNIEQAYIAKKYALLSLAAEQDQDACSLYSRSSKTSSRQTSAEAPIKQSHAPSGSHTIAESKTHSGLNKEKVAARKAISRELPKFDGNAENWPLFIATYNRTTEMCGFTEEENLIRLQNGLIGKALEAVRSLLMYPSNNARIINTLRVLYGQPERIIHQLTLKIGALPTPKEDRLETLVDFAVAVQNYCATVEACDIPDYLYNVTLLHQLVGKLPPTVKLQWAQHKATLPEANLSSFSDWLFTLAEAVSGVIIPSTTEMDQKKPSVPQMSDRRGRRVNSHTVDIPRRRTTETGQCCVVCNKNCKLLTECKTFQQMTRQERWEVVNRNALCRSCLQQYKGPPEACCSFQLCGKHGCVRKHHQLLHNEHQRTNPSLQQPRIDPNLNVSHNTHLSVSGSVLLKYVPITVVGAGKQIDTFALLDEGSELTLIDQALVDEMELNGKLNPLSVKWSDGTIRAEPKSQMVNIQIVAAGRKFTLKKARTVAHLKLTPQTANMTHLADRYQHLKGLPLVSYENATPRILIGASHPQIAAARKIKEGRYGEPLAAKTSLGWTVYGPVGGNAGKSSSPPSLYIHRYEDNVDADMHRALLEYFSLDNMGVTKPAKPLMAADDERAMNILQTRTSFNGTRYETGLLWRFDNVNLPPNKDMALRRHQNLERRMEKYPELARVLKQTIADYCRKDYIRELSTIEQADVKWYLPIFPVVNPNKPGKVRIVWDAAAKTYQGLSLNSMLLKGPDLVTPLFDILLRFRVHRIGIAGDIREMFHQIGIIDEDQRYQCFLWTKDDGKPAVYAMKVMTFGACCSPCTAQYIKNLNADQYQASHPEAWSAIVKSHYVDDLLISVKTEAEAAKLINDVGLVHAAGGFEIRNWISNSTEVMSAVQQSSPVNKYLDLSSEPSMEKVLGMWWDIQSDMLTYKIGWQRFDEELLTGKRHPTKREMLKVLMTIFDPLGLIAHYLCFLKVVIQDVWRSGVDWDEEVNSAEYNEWIKWVEVLPQVEQ